MVSGGVQEISLFKLFQSWCIQHIIMELSTTDHYLPHDLLFETNRGLWRK